MEDLLTLILQLRRAWGLQVTGDRVDKTALALMEFWSGK